MEARPLAAGQLRQAILFFAVLACLLASKGLAFMPGYMLDDYLHTDRFDGRELAYLSQGRFTEAALQLLTSWLGFRWTELYILNLTLLFLAYAYLISLFVGSLAPGPRALPVQLLGGGLIAVHPFFTELVSFREAAVNSVCFVGFLCLFFHAWLSIGPHPGSQRGWRLHAGAAAALTLALGAYQAALPLAVCLLLLVTFQRALGRVREQGGSLSVAWLVQWRLLLPVPAAVLAYALVNILIALVLPVGAGDARGRPAGFGEILGRGPDILALLAELLYGGSAFQSPALSLLLLLLLGGGLFCLWRACRSAALPALLLFLALLLLCVAPLAMAGVWWPVYRALPAVGFLVGGMLTLCLGQGGRPPLAFLLLGGLAIWALAGQSNRILFDQWRLNRWDMSKAQLLVHDIQRLYGADFREEVSLIVGRGRVVHSTPLASAMRDHGRSAFDVAKVQSGLLREATGRRIGVIAADEPMRALCDGSPIWPQEGAIHKRGDVLYVCL
ncbi:glucosyltransferase domain-containing protein [Pseudomonas schmalbachii]|uniref:Glucosyltransferase domain-containing protein n=1 Tax=Pseudomonas schmalbachii TaxID=2816993 RepID=A0ABS3TR57_9PSED|nr:glucosyltransferase domain-containing protein [Pseudomonas schmalbachii]MBO3276154.1 glucosyltransferase domain-containing protein [Pseudomonas schmalbachii]